MFKKCNPEEGTQGSCTNHYNYTWNGLLKNSKLTTQKNYCLCSNIILQLCTLKNMKFKYKCSEFCLVPCYTSTLAFQSRTSEINSLVIQNRGGSNRTLSNKSALLSLSLNSKETTVRTDSYENSKNFASTFYQNLMTSFYF